MEIFTPILYRVCPVCYCRSGVYDYKSRWQNMILIFGVYYGVVFPLFFEFIILREIIYSKGCVLIKFRHCNEIILS